MIRTPRLPSTPHAHDTPHDPIIPYMHTERHALSSSGQAATAQHSIMASEGMTTDNQGRWDRYVSSQVEARMHACRPIIISTYVHTFSALASFPSLSCMQMSFPFDSCSLSLSLPPSLPPSLLLYSITQTYHGGQDWRNIGNFIEDFSVTTNGLGTPVKALEAARKAVRKEGGREGGRERWREGRKA